MMPLRFLLANASLLFLAAASVPLAAAEELPVELNTAMAMCDTYHASWDSDKDGKAEAWTFCATPPCGCNCPAAGALVQVATPTEQRNYLVVGSCQSGYGTSTEAGDGSVGVKVTPVLYGGGLQPLIDDIKAAISLP